MIRSLNPMIQHDSLIHSNNQMVRGSDWFDSFVYLISSFAIRCGSVRFKDGSVYI